MKILFVIDMYDSANNGTTITTKRFATYLRQRGHEVRILCHGTAGEHKYILPERKIPIFSNLIHEQGYLFANSQAKDSQPIIRSAVRWADIVHCLVPFGLCIRTVKIARQLHKPVTAAFHIQPENIISSIHLKDVHWANALTYRLARKVFYQHVRYIHCPSQMMADELVKRGYKAKLYPISNGIVNAFRYTKEPKCEQLVGKTVIVMIGRLSEEKRQATLIKAAALSRYAQQIQLLFAGQGPTLQKLQALSANLPNAPIFKFYTQTELIHILAQADVYVNASEIDSESISTIEAIACGLVPIIAQSQRSAAKQFALDERSLFPVGNAKALAEKIDYWLEHKQERRRMESKYADFAQTFAIERSISRFESMLNEAILNDYRD